MRIPKAEALVELGSLLFSNAPVVELRFQIFDLTDLIVMEPFVSPVVAHVQDNVGNIHDEQKQGAIFQHPDFGLKTQQQIKILAVAVHIKTEANNKQKDQTKHRVQNKPVDFHYTFIMQTNLGDYSSDKNPFLMETLLRFLNIAQLLIDAIGAA